MYHKKSLVRLLVERNSPTSALLIVVLLGIMSAFLPGTAYAQQAKDYKLTLRSRGFTPQPGIRPLFRDSLTVQLARGEKRHVFIQLTELPNRAIRQRLVTKGIRLLSYIGGNSYYATVDRPEILGFETLEAKRDPALSLVRWIGQIKAADRVEPDVLEGKFGDWAINDDGTVKIRIMFFADVDSTAQIELLSRYTNQFKQHSTNIWQLSIDPKKIPLLINEDRVHWIEQEPPPYEVLNDVTRNEISIDVVQNFDPTVPIYNGYSGDGIQAMVRDHGIDTHDDFQGRLFASNALVSDHGTHVAGILGGSGLRSNMNDDNGNPNGGTAFQWRGMAPNVQVVGYGVGWDATTYSTAMSTYGVDISNHSHVQSCNSAYTTDAVSVDEIVRNDTLYVFAAAGNSGERPRNCVFYEGYFSIIGSVAKNSLCLGNYNSASGLRWITSSMGPTFDGRIKPDVMAPGRCISTVYDNGYDFKSGTSMASPCAAGVTTLMLEAFWDTYGDDNPRPLFSTMKAILIETADDLVQAPNVPGQDDCPDFAGGNAQPPFYHAGPDWATGYGLINAEEAVSMIRNKSFFLQDSIEDIGDTDEFPIYVPVGAPELRVTIVWDDSAGDPTTPKTSTKLVNDLNLVLIEPNGITAHEPWVLNPLNPANDGNLNPADIVAATTGEDHLNNVEQVQVLNPASGIWIAHVDESGLPQPTQSYSLASNLAFSRRDLAVVQVLDRTGSMDYYGYINPAKEKAKLFIDLMQPEEQVGVVSFATSCGSVVTSPSVDYSLTTISPAETEKTAAKNDVDGLVAQGCTPIGAGMELGQNQLNSATAGYKPVMILLSDGYENRAPWVADVLPTIPSNTDIYTIALGTTVDATLLQSIATTTGGEYYNAPTIEELQKIYLELHGAVLSLDELALEEGELSSGAEETEGLDVDPLTEEATFVATWLDPGDNLTVELHDPNNNVISGSPSVTIYSDNTYRAYRVKNPVPGKWRMKLTGANVTSAKANYMVTGFVDSRLRLSILPHLIKFLTGDRILLAVKITADTKPVYGAQVKMHVNRPMYWAGNILAMPRKHGYVMPKTQIKTAALAQAPVADSLTSAAKKFFSIVSGSTKDLLARDRFEITLYDDGRHGDEKPRDGIYANYLTKTEFGGDYNFTVKASCSVNGTATTRGAFFSTFNAINIHPDYSTIYVKYLAKTTDGNRYSAKVVPKDRFGNYLGPGHQVMAVISHPDGMRQIQFSDNIDGTYTKEIYITQNELDAGATWEIGIDGKKFTSPRPLPSLRRWSVSVHGGSAIPMGPFADTFDLSFNVLVDIDYHLSPYLAIVGLFGYNDFKSKITGVDDNYWINLSANLRYYQPVSGPWSIYVGGGPGYYIPKDGDSGFGANAGCGVNYEYSSPIAFELGADYHWIFDPEIQFVHSHAGLILRF